MNSIAIVVLTVIFTVGLLGMVYCITQFLQHKRQLETQVDEMKRMLAFIAKGHQLATILDIKGAELSVTPEQFEPKSTEILKIISELINKKAESYDAPSTWAYVVMSHSGLNQFLNSDTRRKTEEALTRLRSNGDTQGALAFMHDFVGQLCAPKEAIQ